MTTQQNHSSESLDVCVWLSHTVRGIVDDAAAVHVAAIDGHVSTLLEVTVAPMDVRRLIGRRGRTADGIRALLLALGGKDGRRYRLEIVEPDQAVDGLPRQASLDAPRAIRGSSERDAPIDVEHRD